METPDTDLTAIDYRLAFEHSPVGMVLSRHRIIDCNARLCRCSGPRAKCWWGSRFGAVPERRQVQRIGSAWSRFTPAAYADNRMMNGSTGDARRDLLVPCQRQALNRAAPHEAGIWTFEDLGSRRSVKAELTPREREVAAQVMQGRTSKEIGKALAISHRTVEIHRARLMRKYAASTTAELVQKLIAG
jgi:DNA-binding CsgD family transcriptional regulator